jgi:60 kDa SS-A/Ro ribonucleoprotein
MTALIRNLATMTRVGVIESGSASTAKVVAQLGDAERIRKARVHPIALLAALRTYQSGHGARGRHGWEPVRDVVDALDGAFYTAFENVEPAGTRVLLALDVSGSMTWGQVAGVFGLTPRDASAALALVTAATESRYEVVGFFAGKGGFRKHGAGRFTGHADGPTPLAISPRQRLDDAVKAVSDLPFGGTDCALPMRRRRSGRSTRLFSTPTQRLGRVTSTRSRLCANTARRRGSTHASWSSGWSRTGSRSPIQATGGCWTSSDSTPRRHS